MCGKHDESGGSVCKIEQFVSHVAGMVCYKALGNTLENDRKQKEGTL
jgi:hypothetical protein